MSAHDVTLPPWRRPVRIPEHVPLEHADPPFAFVGRQGTWRLPFRLARDVAPDTALALQCHGGRNVKGVYAPIQTEHPNADGYVSAELADGTPVALRKLEQPPRHKPEGVIEVVVPPAGLRKDDVLMVTLHRSTAPNLRILDKFFLLYDPAPAGAGQDIPETMLSGDGRVGRSVRTIGAVWDDELQPCIVAACSMHVLGGPIHHIRAYVPSQTTPGHPCTVLVRPEDAGSNLSHETPGDLAVFLDDRELPAAADRVPESTCVRLTVRVEPAGVRRIKVVDKTRGIEAVTNPTVCRAAADHPVLWGMIHGHTELSDGTGSIEYYFQQMRDEARLDFAAPGDHDHLNETPDRFWTVTRDAVERWNRPGRFVTFLGYEWAKWRRNGDGDRNVYYREDHRPMYRSDESNHPRPPDLFEAIKNETALVIPHHTGHSGNFCDWKDHDPVHERLVEIYQFRGSYERPDDNPLPEHGGVPVMDCGCVSRALAAGWRVGFTGGGDDHLQHAGTEFPRPGHDNGYKAGLMAVLASECTRDAIWDALWNRRVVATSGPRILLDYHLNGSPMGAELCAATRSDLAARRTLDIVFHGTAPADRIDIIRNNHIVQSFRPGELDAELSWEDATPLADALLPPAAFCGHPFCFYYVRALQADREMAWASPVWIDPA